MPAKYPFLACKPKNSFEKAISPRSDLGKIFALVGVEKANFLCENEKMEIKLTKEQYENLLKLVYLGNWMVNAIRSGAEGDEQIEKYNEIEQYIFSFAKKFGLEKYIEFDEKYNQFFPTRELEQNPEVEKYLQDYNEEIFWQELAERLGTRDFVRKYSKEAIEKMDPEERFLKHQEFIIKYEEEFEKNGIENLEILKKLDDIL